MNIRFLETVIWLAHYRNFRLTGEHLHMTQPAISSRIQAIEQELGVRLFERTARDVVVTPAGEAFVAEAREIVRRFDAMVNRHRSPEELSGLLRIGLSSSMAHLLLPDILRDVREHHPALRLEVLTDDTAEKLTTLLPQHRVDLCLTAHPLQHNANLRTVPLCSTTMVWAASPSLVPSSDYVYSPSDLRKLPVVTYASGTVNASRIREFFGHAHADIPHVITSNSLATSLLMAVNGIGVAVLPLALIQREVAQGLLHVLKTHPPFAPTSYAAVWMSDRQASAAEAVARLAQLAAHRLRDQFSSDVVFVAEAGD